MTHAHFDLASAETRMRADIAEATAQGEAAVAAGALDAQLFRAGLQFDEARLQFTLACMRAENEGTDRNNVIAAAGFALGSAWASMLAGCVGSRERALMNGWVSNALAAQIGPGAASKTIESVIEPIVSGNA